MKRQYFLRLGVALVFLAIGAACDAPVAPTPGPTNGGVMTTPTASGEGAAEFIADTAQAQFGTALRIGVGNIWEEEYTAADGTTATGLTAGLWLFVRDQPALDRHVRVHAGQLVELAGHQIAVVAVAEEGVTLRVALPPAAP